MAEISPTEWDAFIAEYPNPHILQSIPWGQLKANFGWQVVHVASQGGGAQIMIRRFLPGIYFAYIPKGPIGVISERLWQEMDDIARSRKCAFLKIEPDEWEGDVSPKSANQIQPPFGCIKSNQSIQPMRTLVIDLSGDEAQILARMKQKTRYNINLALKKNVIAKPLTDLGTFYDLMEITGERDRFSIHSLAYYQQAYELFHNRDLCQLLVAEYEGEPVSALMVFRMGRRAWYFYGASSEAHRDKMPSYLLQWEAMRWAKSQGCQSYDLWGVPDSDADSLEAQFSTRSDGLWGVYRFKRGFGGELKRSTGPWDRVYNPYLYQLYSLWLKYRKIKG